MILKHGMQHRGLKLYKVYINGDLGLSLTFHGMVKYGNLGHLGFSIGKKVKTLDFSETIAACDLKVGSCRQLIELMKLCDY